MPPTEGLRVMKENLVTENLQHKLYNVLASAIMRQELPPGKPLLTVRELCAQYNVSVTTVKAVLKRLQQEKLIRPRRSRPALVCRPPKNSGSLRIGVVLFRNPESMREDKIEYSTGPFGWMLYRAILFSARQNRISCSLFESLEEENIQAVDGVIAIGGNEDFYRQLCRCGKLFVNLMAGSNARCRGSLYLDRLDAMKSSAFYFLSGGVKTFYIAGYHSATMLGEHRREGFDRVLLENSVLPERLIELPLPDVSKESGRILAQQIVTINPERPVGILTRGDFVARGAVEEFMKFNWLPKKDFFIIGITDLEESARGKNALTVQSCPYEALGAAAVELLKKNIAHGALNEPNMLKSRLIIRKT